MSKEVVRSLRDRVDRCMLADQPRVRRWLGSLKDGGVGSGERAKVIERARREIERSSARREARERDLPKVSYPPELPVSGARDQIADAVRGHQVVVVCGETGSGKTTQLPKICLELGRGVGGLIGHTQPRRIAARSVAQRIAEELGSSLGGVVGYKVRFNDRVSDKSYVKLMTDGILLAETQGDRLLRQYDTIIIDEAHERSLNIDFLLGYLRQMLPRRPDLKLIITSATIDPERLADHFRAGLGPGAQVPIIEVSGRTYPVEVRYRPPPSSEDVDVPESHPGRAGGYEGILDAVDEIAQIDKQRHGGTHGDILVFLPGEREIREAAEELRKHHPPETEILPLFARLSAQQQMKVFAAHRGRRIVLATNVAETSLTVPGIRYVIDTGLARISRYTARTRVQRLPVEPISRASADQRKGRCGRVSDGVCIRLYDEQDFLQRPEFTDPEILRTNLASVILQMKFLGLGDPGSFPFVESPDPKMIRDGERTLLELGAIDEQGGLTEVGHKLARLPVDPRIGRMILHAEEEHCLREMLVIASALSIQDPRERPADSQDAADTAHEGFADESSDFLSYLNLWEFWTKQHEKLSQNKMRKLCKGKFISYMRMREWQDVHRQLHAQMADMGHKENAKPASFDAVHRSLLVGLLSNIGRKEDAWEYAGPNGNRFSIFPGSGLFKKGPKWVVSAEMVRTTRLYARTVARIDPEWVERLAPGLVKREFSEPHWDEKRGEVLSYERVSLWGLELVGRRRTLHAKHNPVEARELFIHHALVEGELKSSGPFFRHNKRLIREISGMEAKLRTHDLLRDQEAQHSFYDKRLPADVCGAQSFESWRKRAEGRNPQILFMRREDLLAENADTSSITEENFPDRGRVAGTSAELQYTFLPGSDSDGVTAKVSVEQAAALDADQAEWLVPGMLREKVEALIRSLPKDLRVNFVPAPETASRVVESMGMGEGRLIERTADALWKMKGVRVTPGDFDLSKIPAHLRLNVRVVGEDGSLLASGRDVDRVRREIADHVRRFLRETAGKRFAREGVVAWDLGELEERVEIREGGARVTAYPALVDRGSSVSLTLMESAQAAGESTGRGLARLFFLQLSGEIRSLIELQPGLETTKLWYAPIGTPKDLVDQLGLLVSMRAFVDQGLVRDREGFERRLDEGWDRLGPSVENVHAVVHRLLGRLHAVQMELSDAPPPHRKLAEDDVRVQLRNLTPSGFLLSTPWVWLTHMWRYLESMRLRLTRLEHATTDRDTRRMGLAGRYWNRYVAMYHAQDGSAEGRRALGQLRWTLEEYRVWLFSQELGTSIPISEKRLEAQFESAIKSAGIKPVASV